MSRLAYFQRTLADDVPRPSLLPASPPETELSQQPQHGASSSLLNPGHGPADQETPAGRFRRLASSISYHNTNATNVAREARPVGPRTSRWLVVVLPPQNLLNEPAQLGHTLSTSPANRFNNGILMPLFPTMYGQLTAIAREFGLPSVSGVCIYIHMEGGPSMAPRVSDDTWGLLWGHLFDDLVQPSTALPICGRIEFDIDARKARWFNAWAGVHRGETIEHPISASLSGHQRQQSRTSFFGDEDLRSENGLFPLHLGNAAVRNPAARPRKAAQKPADIVVPKPPTPPSESAPSQKRLSPVAQEDEPVTAKLIEVDRKIMQWRMTSGSTPNQFSNKTGQISLDPAHMPNTVPGTPNKLPAAEDDEEDVELNLDDFTWSISSAGPESYAVSPINWASSRLASPDIAFRMLESAPCTPTTATSWGPASDVASAFDDAYDANSLDLGHRFAESMPVTPMTGTSWGPGSYAASPVSEYYAASISIGQRMLESQPTTPLTATSWGPGSYPPSPFVEEHIPTPGFADVSFDDERPLRRHALRPTSVGHMIFPYNLSVGTSTRPWNHVWPYGPQAAEETEGSANWNKLWPYNSQPAAGSAASPWNMVWPYRRADGVRGAAPVNVALPGSDMTYPLSASSIYPSVNANNERAAMLPGATSPIINGARPWNHVWPCGPQAAEETEGSANWNKLWPYSSQSAAVSAASPWNMVWPYRRADGVRGAAPVRVNLPGSDMTYPLSASSIYPSVNANNERAATLPGATYPFLDGIYPKVSTSAPIAVILPALYPTLDIYPAGYPENLESIYPHACGIATGSMQSIVPISSYPSLTIYAPTYPTFDIYPAPAASQLTKPLPLPVDLAISYPSLSVYRATYPSFDIYPSAFIGGHVRVKAPPAAPTKATGLATWHSAMPVSLKAAYPEMDLYPTVYPFNLLDIYGTDAARVPLAAVSVDAAGYPFTLGVYRPVYPHLIIYEPILADAKASVTVNTLSYPFFDGIYAAVYPFNLDSIYASASPSFDPRIVNCVAEAYPFVNGVYAAVYPWSMESIYTPLTAPVDPRFACLAELYPFAYGVYPPVYPFNLEAIYSPVTLDSEPTIIETEQYPFLIGIYPAVYPHNLDVLYPPTQLQHDTAAGPAYPFMEIYESCYPHVCPYPPMAGGSMPSRTAGHTIRHRRSITPPRGQVLRDVTKTHAVRRSLSRRLSTMDAPPVPKIPVHIRSSSSRSNSPVEMTNSPRLRKSHQQLHDQYFSPGQVIPHRKTHAELHAKYYVVPIYERPLPQPKVARLDTLQEEPQPGVAGSHRAAASHSRRMSANLDKLVQKFSPDTPSSAPTPSSAASASGRPVSRLDRSKFPFA